MSAKISVLIRDKEKNELFKQFIADMKSGNSNVQVFPFGCSVNIYSYHKLVENMFESVAICINGIHKHTVSQIRNRDYTHNFESAKREWKKRPHHIKKALMSRALTLKYMIESDGYTIVKHEDRGSEEHSITQLSDETILKYCRLAHSSWKMFMLTEGYYPPLDEFAEELISKLVGTVSPDCETTHDNMRKVHECLVEWDTLRDFDRIYGTYFEEYYRAYISSIPKIVSGYEGDFGYWNDIIQSDSCRT